MTLNDLKLKTYDLEFCNSYAQLHMRYLMSRFNSSLQEPL